MGVSFSGQALECIWQSEGRPIILEHPVLDFFMVRTTGSPTVPGIDAPGNHRIRLLGIFLKN